MVSFDTWMGVVDRLLKIKCDITSDDLPDISYRDMYDNGYSEKEAAEEALSNAGYEE